MFHVSRTLNQSIQNNQKTPKKEIINDIDLVRYLSINCLPITIVEKECIKIFETLSNKNYEFPSVENILNKSVSKLYTDTKNYIQKFLKKNSSYFDGIFLTVNCWTAADKIHTYFSASLVIPEWRKLEEIIKQCCDEYNNKMISKNTSSIQAILKSLSLEINDNALIVLKLCTMFDPRFKFEKYSEPEKTKLKNIVINECTEIMKKKQ